MYKKGESRRSVHQMEVDGDIELGGQTEDEMNVRYRIGIAIRRTSHNFSPYIINGFITKNSTVYLVCVEGTHGAWPHA